MNQVDVGTESSDASAVEAAQEEAKSGRRYVSKAARYARGSVESGTFAGVSGGVTFLRGVRSLGRGDRMRGLTRLFLGGLFVAVAIAQRRSRDDRGGGSTDIDQTDVVDTAPDIEDVAGEGESGGEQHASGEEAASVVGTSVDIEDAVSSEADSGAGAAEADSDVGSSDVDQTDVVDTGVDEELGGAVEDESEATESVSYERLGEAAFDEHSGEIPVPQRTFNQQLLSPGSEVFWGVREADDAVLASQLFDPIQDGDGVRYVGSSEVDDDRTLTIPDVVLNHWDEVAGGGTAVVSGTEIVFATTEVLEEDSQLLVVPEQWVDEILGAEEP